MAQDGAARTILRPATVARDGATLGDAAIRALAGRGAAASAALRWAALAMLAAALVLPLFGGQFYTRLAIEAMLFGAIALSVDILLGFAGLLSLGQAAYFGIAAYVTAILYLHVTQSFWLVAAIVLSSVTLLAVVFGAIAIRAKGVYFALITFGAAEVLAKVANNTSALGGSDGLIGIPIATIGLLGLAEISLANSVHFYYFALAGIGLLYLGARRLLGTPFGSVLRAIRDNPDRVPYLGYNPFWYKLLAYVLAAQIAAFGGLIYPLLRGFVAPHLFGFEVSTKAVVMTLVGGIGTLIGPLFGAGVITLFESVIASHTERHLIVLGTIFVVFVIFIPDGVVGLVTRRFDRAPRTESR